MEYMIGGGKRFTRRALAYEALLDERSTRLSSGARYGEIEKKSLFWGSGTDSPVSMMPAAFLGATSSNI